MLLYLAGDFTGLKTGIDQVTHQGLLAMRHLEPVTVIVHRSTENPTDHDEELLEGVQQCLEENNEIPRLAHIFCGLPIRTMSFLHSLGCKLTYSAVVHDCFLVQQEAKRLGWKLPLYGGLTCTDLQDRLVVLYALADVVICPSEQARQTATRLGCRAAVVIPFGCELAVVEPLPAPFVVGFLGVPQPDKGLRYLLQAWKELDYPDALLLMVGRLMTSPPVRHLVDPYNRRGTVHLAEWIPDVDRFYASISLYVQPSISEGFGLPVLEAMAHGRVALCSDGAGAVDVVPEAWRFPAGDVDALADKIDQFRKMDLTQLGQKARAVAENYTWSRIHKQYQNVWRSLL